MIPSDRTFNSDTKVTVDGVTYYRFYNIDRRGSYKMNAKIISTNSIHKQGIVMFFSQDFKGNLKLDGEPLPVLKGLKHYTFREDTLPSREFEISADIQSGYFIIGNGSERTPTDIFDCGIMGNAFWIETLNADHLRFHCNDHDYDDDFDDLVFDIIFGR